MEGGVGVGVHGDNISEDGNSGKGGGGMTLLDNFLP